MVDQFLERPESRPPGDEEAALVELADAVVLDGVAVPHGEGVVVAAGLGVADEEGAVLVLREEQLLLGLHALDLAEVPSGKGAKRRTLAIKVVNLVWILI